MELKLKEFKTIFLAELDKVMLPLGYKYVKSRHAYVLKNKNNWEIEILILCNRWSDSISVETKIGAVNKVVSKTVRKLTRVETELNIWGVFPVIAQFINSPQQTKSLIEVLSNHDIVRAALLWINDFNSVGLPFIDKITTDSRFPISLALQFENSFYFPAKAQSLPVMCKLAQLDNEEIHKMCNDLENEFESFKKEANQPIAAYKQWTANYYKIKKAVLSK